MSPRLPPVEIAQRATALRKTLKEHTAARKASLKKKVRAAGTTCTGITKLAATTFFPRYCFEASRPRFAVGKRNSAGNGGRRDPSDRGFARGNKVDHELREYVHGVHANSERLGKRPTPLQLAEALVPAPGAHPFTAKLASGMSHMGLYPVAGQVVVEDEATRIGTACDLVCIDTRDGGTVIVEVKCGFDGYLDAKCGNMRYECGMLPDSPRQQHQVQLALTTALFSRTYGLRPARAFVLRACDEGVHFSRLRSGVLKLAPAMLLRMAATRDTGQ